MNKRERMLAIKAGEADPSYVPAAFFLHFDPTCHRGRAAINKHLEFFRHTDMDICKIQFECPFPVVDEIQTPADWAKLPIYGVSQYWQQLDVVEGLVREAKDDALVIMTLYSPYNIAQQAGRGQEGVELLDEHLKQDADAAKVGIERAAESLMVFVRGCIDLGVDGFYNSTQGGEAGRFDDPAISEECIKPSDLLIWEEMAARCDLNILHVCDYHYPYGDLTPFVDYPGDIVNVSLDLADGKKTTAKAVSELFGKPFMGGLERHGAIASGDRDAIRAAVTEALAVAPEQYVLAADCTVASETNWDDLRFAIDLAHQGRA